ncbi:MAG: alkaline phosphatase [Rhodothermales bacterium]
MPDLLFSLVTALSEMRRFSVLLLSLLIFSCTAIPEEVRVAEEQPRNVVFFIADGCGPASFSLARDYQREMEGIPNLSFDRFEQGSTITFAEGSRITDSAASATAYACGVKTLNGRIAMTADSQPVETILEMAESAGYNTALVSTARITHATPASFSSHVVNRGMEVEIAEQQLTKDIEILMGGGRQYYTPSEQGGGRQDGRDLIEEAESAGYHRAYNRAEMMAIDELPLIALFTNSHMAYEIDRVEEDEPSIAEMTMKSLELLNSAGKPFFIMIEAGRIDHAGHGNDTAAHLWDVIAYDQAWQAAVEFARETGNTLVLATSDHETGGLTLGAETGGRNGSGYGYDPTQLASISSSVEAFRNELAERMMNDDVDPAWFGSTLETRFNIPFSTVAEPMAGIIAQADTNAAVAASRLQWLLVDAMAESARVGWSTGGHTSVNVPIFAFGPGSTQFRGTLDNTEIGIRLQEVLGLR